MHVELLYYLYHIVSHPDEETMTEATQFNAHFDQWKAGQATPWMQLRYTLAHEHILQHLPPAAARILDVGGGNGADALPLAQAGYHVAILDYSRAMLDDARQQAQTQQLTAQMTFIEGSLQTLHRTVPEESYHMALCHNIFQYVDAPEHSLDAIYASLVPGGLLSIINPNPASEALHHACFGYDLEQALASLQLSSRYVPTFETTVNRYTFTQWQSWLQSHGFALRAHYGILCVCAYLADNERKYDPVFYQQLLTLERAMGQIEPYIQIARFMHLIAEKLP